jgi:serine/threonine protein kinase
MDSPFQTMHLPPQQEATALQKPKSRNEFAAIRVGGAIDGFQVTGALAEGGMGAVFRAKDHTVESGEVALKAPLPGGRGGSYYHRMRRFLREARLTARMNHDGVARVRHQGHSNGLPYFTLELVDGTPLSERIYQDGVLEIGEAARVVEGTARAAHHIHQKGVVHRDLKPANILIRNDGTPVIIDFGLARDTWGIDPRITESGIWLGTPAYIAPEQATGDASRVDARADVYSLGAVLYELLTGLPPFGLGRPRTIFKALRERDPQPVSQRRHEVPAALERIVMKAISRNKDERYANAEALANALSGFLADYVSEDTPSEFETLEISENMVSDEDVARGWNSDTASLPTIDPAAFDEPAIVPLETERKLADSGRRKSGRKRASTATPATLHKSGRRRTSGARRKSSKAAPTTRRASGSRSKPKRRIRREDGMENIGRVLAFCGPALAMALGLLLLL